MLEWLFSNINHNKLEFSDNNSFISPIQLPYVEHHKQINAIIRRNLSMPAFISPDWSNLQFTLLMQTDVIYTGVKHKFASVY